MPWHLQEVDGGYYVVDDKGKRYSAKPIPKWRAAAQMRALYTSEPGVTKKHHPGGHDHDQSTHAGGRGRAQEPEAPAFNRSEWEGKDLKTRVEAWKAMDQRERDRLANAKEVIGSRQKELLAEAGERPTLESAHGDTKHAIEMRLDSLKGVLSQESSDEIHTIATGLDDLLGISGASPESRHALNMEVVDAIAAQEFEAMGRTLGDHGVPHISGNINFATEMLMQHPGEDRPEDMAAIIVANAFHDSGYLTEPSQIFLDEGHPRWSQEHYDANLRKTVSAALGDQTAAEVSHMIRTHADTSIDWQEDITGSAMRVADNTALFQKEKLPALFRLVPENVKVLKSLAEKEIDHVTAGKKMLDNVSRSKLPTKVKSQLTHAAGEISPVSPKFILGMLGGYVSGFKWAGDHMTIFLKPDNQATIFQKVLDLGQRQFSKLAEAYGLDPKQFLKDLNFKLNDPRSGKTVFEGVILSEKERWRMTLEKLKEKHQAGTTHKHYPGEHNQETHGNRAGAATISAIQPGKLRETFENRRRADRPADQPAGSTERPEWLLPTKAPEHIKNPNKRWVYEKLVGKINDINEKVHILARDFRDSKDAGDWKYLKTLADQAANLIEERAPMLEMLESMAQIKLPIYVPSFSRVTPMGEKPREDPNKNQMGFGFKEMLIWKQIRDGLARLKHYPGEHNQETHGNRAGSAVDASIQSWKKFLTSRGVPPELLEKMSYDKLTYAYDAARNADLQGHGPWSYADTPQLLKEDWFGAPSESVKHIKGQYGEYELHKGNPDIQFVKDKWAVFNKYHMVGNWHNTPEEAVAAADQREAERQKFEKDSALAKADREKFLDKFRGENLTKLDPDHGLNFSDFARIHRQRFNAMDAKRPDVQRFFVELGLTQAEARRLTKGIPYRLSSNGTPLISIPEAIKRLKAYMSLGKGEPAPAEPGPVTPGESLPKPETESGVQLRLFKAIRDLITLKHLPGQHNQKRHGWRYGSTHSARRIARDQRGAEWEEYKRRARSGDTGSKLPTELHAARVEFHRRIRQIERNVKDPKERIAKLDALEKQMDASAKRGGWDHNDNVQLARVRAEAKRELAQAPKEAPAIRGEKTKAFGADPNNSYEFQFKVVDMADLVPSNTKEGGINPDYDPALQPRDRSRAASQQQIDNIAKNLSPETLIYDFHRLDTGAPIVGPDNMVESGNGRVLAMERAKELYPERWEAYQQTMKNSLEAYGINPDEVKGMTAPVLVRERLTKTDRAAFAKESNQAALLTMSPLEVAIQDAGRIKPDSLGRLVVDEDQNIDQALRSPKNVDFVRNFLGGIPDTERGALLRSDGSLNRMGLWRMKAAVFSKVFPGEAGQRISETFLESLDSSIKNFETAISGALPKLAQAESLIAGGRRNKKLSLVTDFSKAIDMLARLRESGTSVKDYVGQRGLFGSELNTRQMKLLNFFDGLSRSPKKLRNFFENYADSIVNATPSGQSNLFGSMFGGELSPEKLVDSLIQRSSQVEAPAAPAGQGGLFAHA